LRIVNSDNEIATLTSFVRNDGFSVVVIMGLPRQLRCLAMTAFLL